MLECGGCRKGHGYGAFEATLNLPPQVRSSHPWSPLCRQSSLERSLVLSNQIPQALRSLSTTQTRREPVLPPAASFGKKSANDQSDFLLRQVAVDGRTADRLLLLGWTSLPCHRQSTRDFPRSLKLRHCASVEGPCLRCA